MTEKTAEYSTCDTPHGKFTVVCESEIVLAAGWTSEVAELLVLIHPNLRPQTITQDDDRCAAAISAVQAFYEGDFSAVEKLAVRQQSGPFRMRAWETLRKVPAGSTLTYGEFAVQAGNPRAIRAAAGACAANAAVLFVPCHRVVSAGGKLGGFRYGVGIKQELLELETQ
jgi:methylated-DNA--[protein]-cysteine S-methyltransferase